MRAAGERPVPALVVVNGPPAAGKTTLARALAAQLRLPLLAKDDLKETLFDSLGTGDRDWSRRLGAATFDLLFMLAERQLEAGRSAVLEANWDARHACPRFARLRERAPFRVVEVHVTAPDDVLRRRFDERAARGERHPGHLDAVVADELDRGEHAGRWRPLPCADERLDVDATTLDGVADAVARRLGALLGGRGLRSRAVSDRPLLLVLSGPPASGKTSVAEELAAELRIPFISKDTFKERLYEVFGHADQVEEQVERAGLALLYSVAGAQLAAGVAVMTESNFDSDTDLGPLHRLQAEHGARLVQVHFGRSKERLLERFVGRIEEGDRHPGHGDEPGDVHEVERKLDAGVWDPLDLPGELIRIDKDDPDFSVDELAGRIREALDRYSA